MDNTDRIVTKKPVVVFKREKVSKKIKSGKPIGSIITSQLLPFDSTMRLQLRRRGYNTNALPLKSVIPLYYNEFVAGDKLTPISHFEFINNPAFKVLSSDNLNGELTDIHKDYFSQISDVVYNIIQQFKLSRDKKNAAIANGMNYMEVLSDEEVVQAKSADKVTNDLQQKLLGATSMTVDDMKNIFIIVIGLWLAYELIKAL